MDLWSSESALGGEKADKKNHIKEFGGRNAPEASQGKIRDVPGAPGTLGPIYVEIPSREGRMSAGQTGHTTGQMGHFHGTDGTHTPGGVPPKFFMFIVFFFPLTFSSILPGPRQATVIHWRWGISLRPRLRRPCSELPDTS